MPQTSTLNRFFTYLRTQSATGVAAAQLGLTPNKRGGVPAPPQGFALLKGADGLYLKGADGAYLYGRAA